MDEDGAKILGVNLFVLSNLKILKLNSTNRKIKIDNCIADIGCKALISNLSFNQNSFEHRVFMQISRATSNIFLQNKDRKETNYKSLLEEMYLNSKL